MASKEEVGDLPEGGGGKFEQDTKVGTASVTLKGEPTKSGCLIFEPGEMSTINWSPKLG